MDGESLDKKKKIFPIETNLKISCNKVINGNIDIYILY